MIDPSRLKHRKLGGISTREKTKMYLVAGIFILVLAAFLGFNYMGKSSEKEAGGEDRETPDSTSLSGPDGQPIHSVLPPRPEEVRDRAEREIREKLEGFRAEGKLQDAATGDDTEVLEYVVNAGMWNYRVTGTRTEFYRQLDPVKVAFEPGPHRGKLVSAWGPVVKVLPETPFPDRIKGVDTLYSVYFRSSEGQLYQVISPIEIPFEVGDWIQAYGIFYRHRKVDVGLGEELAFCIVQITKHEISPAYPPITVEEIDPAWASEIRESSYDEARLLNERPFWLILNYLVNLGAEGYEALKEKGEIEIADFGRSMKRITQEPHRYRFRFVSGEGRVVSPVWQDLSSDNPGKITRFDGAFLIQPSEYIVRLVAPRKWSEYDFEMEEDYVRVEGIFYKNYQYMPSRGTRPVVVPAIVVTGVYPLDTSEGGMPGWVIWGFGGLAVLVVLFFFAMAFKDRRKYAEFRERYLEQRRRRLERGEGGAVSERDEDAG